MTLLIRPALPLDAVAIAAIGRDSFTWAFGHLYRPEVLERYLEATYAVEKIEASLAKPGNHYLVAEQEGTVLGFLKLKEASPRAGGDPGQWQTQKLYIDPARIEGGAGKRLMAGGEALMTARGAPSSWLAVYRGNDRALRFYEALGYDEVGTQQHTFEDLVVDFKVMEKRLA